MKLFKETDKQLEAVALISKNRTTLLEGGSRSGKTLIALIIQCVRAMHYPRSWHLTIRLRFNHAKITIWQKTLPDALHFLGIEKNVKYNFTDFYIEFDNGSRIIVSGLDDKDRVEKILGSEYATIFLNEASQVSYESYETLTTRLNPPKGIPPRFIIDYNPPSKKHWGYKIFHQRIFPDGRPVPDNDYGHILMNPKDNITNLSENYISGTLEQLSGRKRSRFLHGEYCDEEGTLWRREWFKYRKPTGDLQRVVVGVDPSGSKTGDEIGIIPAGIDEAGIFYILGDYTLHASPLEWSNEVYAAYDHNGADAVAAEKNYGGEMVESTITQFGRRNINVKLVTATRGKALRAEPVAALYEKGMIFHTEELPELEDEMVMTKFDELDKSPNRIDALVFAITELAGNGDINVRFV